MCIVIFVSLLGLVLVFFFKQKAAYEMRISDWSSDVCSSDLLVGNVKFATYLGIPHVAGAGELAIFCGAMVGGGLAFLWFNAPPAAVFMGDTGSLALGG